MCGAVFSVRIFFKVQLLWNHYQPPYALPRCNQCFWNFASIHDSLSTPPIVMTNPPFISIYKSGASWTSCYPHLQIFKKFHCSLHNKKEKDWWAFRIEHYLSLFCYAKNVFGVKISLYDSHLPSSKSKTGLADNRPVYHGNLFELFLRNTFV